MQFKKNAVEMPNIFISQSVYIFILFCYYLLLYKRQQLKKECGTGNTSVNYAPLCVLPDYLFSFVQYLNVALVQ